MDQDYQRYLNSYVRWVQRENGNSLATILWVGIMFYIIDQMSEDILKPYAFASIILVLIRVVFLKYQTGLLLKLSGLYVARIDGGIWTFKNAVIYAVVDWLPILLIALYILLFDVKTNIFNLGSTFIFTCFFQMIWAFVNAREKMTGIAIYPTSKKEEKIRKKYENRNRVINKVGRILSHLSHVIFFALITFLVIQTLRIPTENPDFQKRVFGGQELVWKNNTYFAMAGIFAPEHVTDFYQYGLIKAYEKAKYYEYIKRQIGVRPEFWLKFPRFTDITVQVNKEQELSLGDTHTFRCLTEFNPDKTKECSTFANFEKFIKEHKTIWDRYNRIPDIGSVYTPPPQILGGSPGKMVTLGDLKATHIIFLAKNGQPDQAMAEWLRYIKLYRKMANSPESLPFKAIMAVNIHRQLIVLEHLLYLSPDLALKYEKEILTSLKNDEPIFRDPFMFSDDWAVVGPSISELIGNTNALNNNLYECFEGVKKLGEQDLYQFDFSKQDYVLCPMHEKYLNGSTLDKGFIYPSVTPGSYFGNLTSGLMVGGIFKGHELIRAFKITRVKFRQAQLGVQILARQIPASDVPEFIKSVPDDFQNPITRQPFDWDSEKQKLSFTVKGREKDITTEFRLNIRN